jgi:nucleoside-diphosphate-sugar epimerase
MAIMKKIAILGATGYIGKSLTYELSLNNEFDVFLFSRSKEKVTEFLKGIKGAEKFKAYSNDDFAAQSYDVIINCTGIGIPSVLKKSPAAIFKVTEEMDDMAMDYIEKNPATLYINLSTGAVYSGGMENPITEASKCVLNINSLAPSDYYAIAKINSEAKHRAQPNLNIVDLRIFSFFSHFIDLDAHFLISDIIDCLKNKKTFETSAGDMSRDYVCPYDLLALIKSVINKGNINDFFDVYTLGPVSKFELLDFFKKEYGFEYKIKAESERASPTGNKNLYFSQNKKAEEILGFVPKHTSLSGIEEEMGRI